MLALRPRRVGAVWLDIHIYFTAARPDMEGSMVELARVILHESSGIDLITGLRARTRFGRPDFAALLGGFAGEPGLARPDVFFCGPAALARGLSGSCQSLGLPFRYERFWGPQRRNAQKSTKKCGAERGLR